MDPLYWLLLAIAVSFVFLVAVCAVWEKEDRATKQVHWFKDQHAEERRELIARLSTPASKGFRKDRVAGVITPKGKVN